MPQYLRNAALGQSPKIVGLELYRNDPIKVLSSRVLRSARAFLRVMRVRQRRR